MLGPFQQPSEHYTNREGHWNAQFLRINQQRTPTETEQKQKGEHVIQRISCLCLKRDGSFDLRNDSFLPSQHNVNVYRWIRVKDWNKDEVLKYNNLQ